MGWLVFDTTAGPAAGLDRSDGTGEAPHERAGRCGRASLETPSMSVAKDRGSANTQRGTTRFVNELVARSRRDDQTRKLTIPFDSGFWSNATMANLTRLDVRYTMAISTSVAAVQTAIASIDDDAWQSIDYTNNGVVRVAERAYTSGQGAKRTTRRMIVRRTRFTDTTQQRLWPDWRHHAFLTDPDGDVVDVDRFHREHATDRLIVARTIRTRLLALPGRLVNHAGRSTLRLPSPWPWAATFTKILDTLGALEPVPT